MGGHTNTTPEPRERQLECTKMHLARRVAYCRLWLFLALTDHSEKLQVQRPSHRVLLASRRWARGLLAPKAATTLHQAFHRPAKRQVLQTCQSGNRMGNLPPMVEGLLFQELKVHVGGVALQEGIGLGLQGYGCCRVLEAVGAVR